MCINTAKLTFHCQTPLGLLHKVEVSECFFFSKFLYLFSFLQNALCIFNYNIGFFTFIMGKTTMLVILIIM